RGADAGARRALVSEVPPQPPAVPHRQRAVRAGPAALATVGSLCLDCDQPLELHSTEGPDEGSLTVTFRCLECGFRVAMLTNPFETQMVRSLGVKVGGGATPPVPFEHVRTMMANPRADAFEGDAAKIGDDRVGESGAESGGCPFTALVNEGANVTLA